MATSPNFNWPEPDNTDLVKNGALAIRTAVNAIDSSMGDLKGGTTGQVLAKASNTDMDFTWASDAQGIPATIIDAKGDLIAGTAADTAARLAVGANDLLLIAASGETTGLKWGGTYQTWTPARNNITVGNGTETARYAKIGKTVFAEYKFSLGSTSAIGGDAAIQLPIAPAYWVSGTVTFLDAGTMLYQGTIDYNPGNGYCYLVVGNAAGTYLGSSYTTSGIPFTWTTGDAVTLRAFYEVA